MTMPLFPLKTYKYQLPLDPEVDPGAFGAIRKFDIHTGVDLYCDPGTPVYAVTDGHVVEVEIFTGPNADSPWWNETHAVLIESNSGCRDVFCYGEVDPIVKIGQFIAQGDLIGFTAQVLKKDKGRPMCMLHFEQYRQGTVETVWWNKGDVKPENLLNPTPLLLKAIYESK